MSKSSDIPAGTGRYPSRAAISSLTLADETAVVKSLIERAQLTPQQEAEVASLARRLVHAVRAGRRQTGGVDAFMHEYSLSSEEGVVLMCLAEALLRIPDGDTADKLIADKIGGRKWEEHVGKSDSLFVNASSWGLMLTGRFVGLGDDAVTDFQGYFKRLVARSGEPIIRQAMRHAMRIMGKQFVLGRTVEEALKVGREDAQRGYRFSFDMLGEAAMTAEDAARYFAAYENALKVVTGHAGPWKNDAEVFARPSISVKLSAIHPRYEEGQKDRVMAELVPRLVRLAELARDANLGLTVDAEEAERLDISLEVFAAAANAKELAGWNGLGLAVQAYGKRAHAVLEWLADLAQASGRRLPVRLVKGAYWDTEVKRAQEQGFESYPVFTRKASTDVSYLACAKFLLERSDAFFPQFATHNAHTLSAITVMAGNNRDFEFQRLHGMGQALYEEVVGKDKLDVACRIYAPVGSHEDLLAYLVRRLLENGANTSFVNRLADDEAPIREIIADPVEIVRSFASVAHPRIPLPRDLFQPERANSSGVALWEPAVRDALYREMEASTKTPVAASALVNGKPRGGPFQNVTAPHDRRLTVGTVAESSEADVEAALAAASAAFDDWDHLGGEARARLLDRTADLFERDRAKLMAVIVREAGKTLENALGDIREAIDFLRYYAARARKEFARPEILPGPTGERNELSLHGRGVFVSISPWNFPLAIFTGQVAAALAAGNTVIAKPAEQTPLVAFLAVSLMHEAGIPGKVVHLLPGDGAKVGGRLIADGRVAGVAFTGSNETAQVINRTLAGRDGPIVRLIAETGGMNAMIVDSTALPEQAVRDVVASAFDSAGQRCSAARILFVQEDIAGRMIKMLTGAMEELKLGDPWDFATDVGPVIDDDAKAVLDAHKARMAREGKTLADLALPPETGHGTFVAPAAYEIADISVLKREVFGPVLHVVRFRGDRLDDVCRAINVTGYGLTLGVHTRIETTASQVASQVRAGNIYVNRNQIGAVVGVQPFGGERLSGTGPKAGGPHYLHSFAVERSLSVDVTASGGNAALMSLEAEDDGS